jgi:hypothetical protein
MAIKPRPRDARAVLPRAGARFTAFFAFLAMIVFPRPATEKC